MSTKLKVKQVRSGIGRSQRQKDTLRGLGLTKLHQVTVLVDTPQTRGMIRAVSHLIEWEEVQNG